MPDAPPSPKETCGPAAMLLFSALLDHLEGRGAIDRVGRRSIIAGAVQMARNEGSADGERVAAYIERAFKIRPRPAVARRR